MRIGWSGICPSIRFGREVLTANSMHASQHGEGVLRIGFQLRAHLASSAHVGEGKFKKLTEVLYSFLLLPLLQKTVNAVSQSVTYIVSDRLRNTPHSVSYSQTEFSASSSHEKLFCITLSTEFVLQIAVQGVQRGHCRWQNS